MKNKKLIEYLDGLYPEDRRIMENYDSKVYCQLSSGSNGFVSMNYAELVAETRLGAIAQLIALFRSDAVEPE